MYQLLKCRTGEFEDTDRLVHRLAVWVVNTVPSGDPMLNEQRFP
jgi:hypothetical protein